jgi:hypothetical protein
MYSDTKITRSVADAVNKIMNPQKLEEELKGGQKKIDKNHNNKIDGQDFAILRGEKKVKEEVEQIVEYETDKNGKFVHNAKAGRYGGSEKQQDPFAGVRGPGQKDLEKIEAEKKKKQKKFSEMVNLYQEKGLKSLSEMLKKEEPIVEGASEEQYNDQLAVAQFKANTKDDDTVRAIKKKTVVAKGQPIGPVSVDEELEQIEEREMSDAEMNKREDIVKSMKKGMAGFKDRYGDRAKDVMYATATKQAMK